MFLHLISYASLLVFALAVTARVFRIRRLPPHLRWELYPVAHDPRAGHGGSYMEVTDWWEHPQKTSRAGMILAMLPEMIFIRALFQHNRRLWYRSFPFHFGLYLLIGFIGLTGFGALLSLAGLGFGDGFGAFITRMTAAVGWTGLLLASAGAAALLQRRLADEELSDYTQPSHLFNLGFILVTLLCCVLAFGATDRDFSMLRDYFAALIAFNVRAPAGGGLVAAAIFLASLLIAYVPLTHMSHFFTKWFMWHDVRWDDTPMTRGCAMEARVNDCLQQPVTWSGPHLAADGKKNWVDIATEEPRK